MLKILSVGSTFGVGAEDAFEAIREKCNDRAITLTPRE